MCSDLSGATVIIKRLAFAKDGTLSNGYLFGVNADDGEYRLFFDLYNFGLLFFVDVWDDHDLTMFQNLSAVDEMSELES